MKTINDSNIPRHIAIVMDGSGRWAKKRFLTTAAGHRAGAESLRKLAEAADKLGLEYLTVYAFSTENWKRPKSEVDALMNLAREFIQQYIDDSNKNDMRMSVIGDRSQLDADLQEKIAYLEELTKDKRSLHVIIAINYGGRHDILRAVRALCKKSQAGETSPEEIDETMLSNCLDTAGIPDPDLLIRTGGELRISNFLLWQVSYSELYFSEKLWPDFKIKDLQTAIEEYARRKRNYGGR